MSVMAAGHMYQETAEQELSHVKKAKPSRRQPRKREVRKVARRSRGRSECVGQRPRSVPRDVRLIAVRRVPRGFYGGWAVKNSRHNGRPRNTPLTLPDVLLG